jgi:myo-inositol-1(or 4)-monophosphatase
LIDMSNIEQERFVVGRKNFTAVAVNTASKAGQWIKSKVGDFKQLQYKQSISDLVTEVDKGAEQMIRNLIGTHFPDHAFLGEESAAGRMTIEEAKQAEYVWIVDPVDGTTNFVHGFPFYCVSIALAHYGEVIVGVVYDPSNDEMFVAEKGKGAYLHGQKMQVASDDQLRVSLIATGFPANDNALRNLRSIETLLPKVRNIRTTGSAALHLAYVATGRISGFFECGLSIWDMAAGILLVQESGGSVSDVNGQPYNFDVRDLVATNGLIHPELLKELNE